MDSHNTQPPQPDSTAGLLAQIEELKITMAIKEEDAYLRGRNDCIRQYFSHIACQYPSQHINHNQS